MMRHAWFISASNLHGDDAALKVLERDLQAAGLRLAPYEEAGSDALGGIFLCDLANGPTLTRLRTVCADRTRPVLVLATGSGAIEAGGAQRLLEQGAVDALTWDGSPETTATVIARLMRWAETDRVLKLPLVRDNLAGQSEAWVALLRQVIETAAFSQANVLLLGETGTGKELIARLVHSLDQREPKGELVLVDCTTIQKELSGSEFFGHERGAYTGATVARDGAFALADGGTLFLDEVGELPPSMQAELLRAIQEGTYKRVGGNTWQKSRFRLICATNRELVEDAACGRFRWDLYYRIAATEYRLPPLRSRSSDIPILASHFIEKQGGITADPPFDAAVQEYLLNREYPGNVRELQQIVGRMLARHVGASRLTLGDVPEHERPSCLNIKPWFASGFEDAIQRAVSQRIGLDGIQRQTRAVVRKVALQLTRSQKEAADLLDVTPRTLQNIQAQDGQENAWTPRECEAAIT